MGLNLTGRIWAARFLCLASRMGLQEAVCEAILDVLMTLWRNLEHVSPSEIYVTKWRQICNPELQPRVSAGMRCPERIPTEPQSHVEGWKGLCRLSCCDKTAELFKVPRGRAAEASAASASSSLGREPSPGPPRPGGAQRAHTALSEPGKGSVCVGCLAEASHSSPCGPSQCWAPLWRCRPSRQLAARPRSAGTALRRACPNPALTSAWEAARRSWLQPSLQATVSQNRSAPLVGGDRRDHPVPTPCPGPAAPHQISCPRPALGNGQHCQGLAAL